MPRMRLDRLLVHRGLAPSREKARARIMAGEVLVDDEPVAKAGALVAEDAEVRLRGDGCPYVSRGGVKLAGALKAFELEPRGLVCADIGASTGGFTDCLLQRGAARVHAVDVGYGQLAYELRTDPRVVVHERVNARNLTDLGEAVDLVVVDVAFISLRLILPACDAILVDGGRVICLVKPQFEAGRSEVGKGGVVKDKAVHARVVGEVARVGGGVGLAPSDVCASPIEGPAGNREFFLLLRKGGRAAADLEERIRGAVEDGEGAT